MRILTGIFLSALAFNAVHAEGRPAGCPSMWCGCYLRHQLGIEDPAFNLASRWASYGSRANRPGVGEIYIIPHHVGRITGYEGGQWICTDGNWRNTIHTGPCNLRGTYAYRNPY